MYCLAQLCRICVASNRNMKSLHTLDKDNITFHNKLITCVPELKSENLDGDIVLCDRCCQKLNNLYEFRHLCTKNKSVFEGYISQLKEGNTNSQGELFINLKKVEINLSVPVMTVPICGDNSEVMDSFVFDLSPADELKTENCVRVDEISVESSLRDDTIGNIEDLSRSSSEIMFHNFQMNMETDMLENTDGEIKIERDEESMMDQYEPSPELAELKPVPPNEPIVVDVFLVQQQNTIQPEPECWHFDVEFNPSEPIITHQNPPTPERNPVPEPIEIKIEQQCDKEFDRHKKTIHIEKMFKCQKCDKTFESQVLLQKHMTTHVLNKPFKCEICSLSFTCSTSLKRHKFKHSDTPNFQCEFCSEKFMGPSNLKKHIIKHHNGQVYKCELCSSVFNKMYDLKAHERSHTGKQLHECEVCKKSYFSANSLRRHKKEVHEKMLNGSSKSSN